MARAGLRALATAGLLWGAWVAAQNIQIGGAASYASGSGYYQSQVGEQPAYASASGGCSYDRNSNTRIKPPKGTIIVNPDGH